MENFSGFLRAAAIALPLATAAVSAESADTVGRTIETTRVRTTASLHNVRTSEVSGQDFRGEVREYLHREKCYVLTKAPKNTSAWLAAIGDAGKANEAAPVKFDGKAADAFERAKERLEAERAKAGTSWMDIMSAERRLSSKERECLSGESKTMI